MGWGEGACPEQHGTGKCEYEYVQATFYKTIYRGLPKLIGPNRVLPTITACIHSTKSK